MAKNKVSEWSSIAANNTDIAGIDISEGCAPSGINNAIRELMAQVKDMQSGTDADNFAVGGKLSVTGTSTFTGAITASGGVTGNVTGNVIGNVTGTAANVTGTVAIANGGTGQTTAANAFAALKQDATNSATGVVELLTTAEHTTGTDTTRALTTAVARAANIVRATSKASTSGTSIDFTGIPAWAKRITIMFDGVSTNGTSDILIQIGDSGGVETSGYLGASADGATLNVSSYTTGFGIRSGSSSATIIGLITINNLNSNTWIASGTLARGNTAVFITTAGSKSLTATLDRVRITTVNGTDAFDAGSINIFYE